MEFNQFTGTYSFLGCFKINSYICAIQVKHLHNYLVILQLLMVAVSFCCTPEKILDTQEMKVVCTFGTFCVIGITSTDAYN